MAAAAVTSLVSMLDALVPSGGVEVLRLQGALLSAVVFVIVVWLVYVIVPRSSPGARLALVPALVIGACIGLLTTIFGALTPLLVGGNVGIGLLAVIFATLVWLRLVFDLLIFGAAWTRIRRDRVRRLSVAATLDS